MYREGRPHTPENMQETADIRLQQAELRELAAARDEAAYQLSRWVAGATVLANAFPRDVPGTSLLQPSPLKAVPSVVSGDTYPPETPPSGLTARLTPSQRGRS